MTRDQRKKRLYAAGNYLLRYTLLFAVTALGVYCWFILYGRSMSWEVDSSAQYIPKAVYFIRETKEFLAGLLRGEWNFKMYDFNIGLGNTAPMHLEPLYWLFLLFDEGQVEYAYGFLLILRLYLSGLSFTLFLRHFRYSRWSCLIGSMVYVFSGFALYAGTRHTHFTISMLLLPLLLLSIEEIYKKKRWYLCTVFVAVSFWCGYYFTYMSTILMGVYFLIRFFGGEEDRSIRVFFLRVRTIIGSYLLGIGIANLTFFSSFVNYLSSARTGAEENEKFSLWSYGFKWLVNCYQAFLSTSFSPGEWLWLGFIPLTYLCVALLFLRKGNRQLKAAFLIGTLFCCVPVFGYLFSGFGTINNRWCYGYAFVAAVITAKMVGELPGVSRREALGLTGLSLPYQFMGIVYILLGSAYEYKKSVILSGFTLMDTLLLVLMMRWSRGMTTRRKKVLLIVNAVALLWVSGLCRFSPWFDDMQSAFTKSGKVWETAAGTELQVLDELEDDSFYRASTPTYRNDELGASMMLEYNGIAYFSSTQNSAVVDFYREMGLSSWSLVRIRGFDNRGFLDSLACVKYQVMSDQNSADPSYGYEEVKEVLRNEVYYQIYENQNVLPIGYCYDQVISREEFDQLDTAQRQEVMLQAAVVEDTDAAEGCDVITEEMIQQENAEDENAAAGSEEVSEDSAVTITGQKALITEISCSAGIEYDGTTICVTKENAKIKICFEGLANCETYVMLENLHMSNAEKVTFYFSSDSEENDFSYLYHGDYQTYYTGQEDYLFNLGYSEEGKTYCTISFDTECTFTVEDIGVYCQPMEALDEYIADRSEDAMENVEIGTNQVTGTIQASKEELLVFSIPYQNGWTVKIDGEETPIQKVNIMYMGVTVPEGSHTIELTYEMPGLRISLVISAVSLAIFAGALVIRRKRKACSTAS